MSILHIPIRLSYLTFHVSWTMNHTRLYFIPMVRQKHEEQDIVITHTQAQIVLRVSCKQGILEQSRSNSTSKQQKSNLYLSKHLVLILQSGEPLFKLSILSFQLINSSLQIDQICLLSLPRLLGWDSIPQQPYTKIKKQKFKRKIKWTWLPKCTSHSNK